MALIKLPWQPPRQQQQPHLPTLPASQPQLASQLALTAKWGTRVATATAQRESTESVSERVSEQGKFLSTRASLRATAATAATAPGAVGNKIFDASCPSLRAGMCVEVCDCVSV